MSVGSVTMAASVMNSLTRPSLPMLCASSSTTKARTRSPARVEPGILDRFGAADHRRQAGFHILRATAVQLAVAYGPGEGFGHAFNADGVGMAVVHE